VEQKVRDGYLAKLKQAEEIARQFPAGSFERESWTNIANGYRYLLDRTPKPDGLVWKFIAFARPGFASLVSFWRRRLQIGRKTKHKSPSIPDFKSVCSELLAFGVEQFPGLPYATVVVFFVQ
jgi:hypothetical protein